MPDRTHAALMLEHTLALLSWETERPIDQLVDELREGNHAVHSSFRYTLARIVARELRAYVKAVYVYGSPMENRARLDSDIDLLVVVNGKRRYAQRRLQELDRSLVEQYHAFVGPSAENMTYLLDFHLITRSDVRRRKGYAAILSDPYALPPELIFQSSKRAQLVA